MPEEFLIEVPEAGEGFWKAFEVLSRGRTIGGGMTGMPNRLQYSEIVLYARVNYLPVEDTVTLVYQLDEAYLGHVADTLRRGQTRSTRQAAGRGRVRARPDPREGWHTEPETMHQDAE